MMMPSAGKPQYQLLGLLLSLAHYRQTATSFSFFHHPRHLSAPSSPSPRHPRHNAPYHASPSSLLATSRREGSDNAVGAATAALTIFAAGLLSPLVASPPAALAVSGGGLDYANLDLTGQDFSKSSYKGKDFTQIIAKGTNFAGSNLVGCRFYKAYLVNADFSGADLTGASLEDTSMDGANLKDAVVIGSYFSASLLDAGSIENADFTDAQLPPKLLPRVCDREDAKGTNPVTGVDTRDSLFCP